MGLLGKTLGLDCRKKLKNSFTKYKNMHFSYSLLLPATGWRRSKISTAKIYTVFETMTHKMVFDYYQRCISLGKQDAHTKDQTLFCETEVHRSALCRGPEIQSSSSCHDTLQQCEIKSQTLLENLKKIHILENLRCSITYTQNSKTLNCTVAYIILLYQLTNKTRYIFERNLPVNDKRLSVNHESWIT